MACYRHILLDDARRDAALETLRSSRNRLGYQDEVHSVEVRNRSSAPFGARIGVATDWIRHVVHDAKKLWTDPRRNTESRHPRDQPG